MHSLQMYCGQSSHGNAATKHGYQAIMDAESVPEIDADEARLQGHPITIWKHGEGINRLTGIKKRRAFGSFPLPRCRDQSHNLLIIYNNLKDQAFNFASLRVAWNGFTIIIGGFSLPRLWIYESSLKGQTCLQYLNAFSGQSEHNAGGKPLPCRCGLDPVEKISPARRSGNPEFLAFVFSNLEIALADGETFRSPIQSLAKNAGRLLLLGVVRLKGVARRSRRW